MGRHTVIGAGNSGLAMAAHLAYNGESVAVWNRTFANIADLAQTRAISCTGVISGTVPIAVASNNMREVLAGAECVFVTTPADAHADVARTMAPYIRPEQTVVLNPGRTLGAWEFSRVLRQSGCRETPQIAETQTIVYTCRKTSEDSVQILRTKSDVLLSCVEASRNAGVVASLPECLRAFFVPARSVIETSVGNVGMILHCYPVLLNVGWIENPTVGFKYYYSGITESIAGLLERLDEERVRVAARLGHPVEGIVEWFRRSYGTQSQGLYEVIQENQAYRTIDAPTSLRHRYIYEDISCGLVPLESIGEALGMELPLTRMCIDLADAVLREDFRRRGRTLKGLAVSIEDLRNT